MTNSQSDEVIVVENEVIEKVDRYKYLGQTVMMEDHTREEVTIRIKAGWSCFGRFKDILCDKKLLITLRRRMYNQCVLPTMTYGAQTWTTTKQLENKLQVEQRAMKRKMLHIILRDKIKNTDIRRQTKVKDIIQKIKVSKWKWAGHLMRREDNIWTKRATEWQPRTGKRKRGRPKRRWRDDLDAFLGILWARLAQDRDKWQNHEEGYIQQWMDTAW